MDELLARYKKERPDIFARLPLPVKMAEEWGIPAKDDVIHLNDYLKAFMSLREERIDVFEEKKCPALTKEA